MRAIWNLRGVRALSFLGRLRRNVAGNTLALAAAAVIPLIGMVGSGVDMGRSYLIKTRLQQACDAGVLAARKSMTFNALTGSPGDTVAQAQGNNFFNINLRSGMYGSEAVTFAMSDVTNPTTGNASGRVHGVATAKVPMTIMKIFGNDYVNLQAICDAELNVANNDIMFALDVTGSMACTPETNTNDCGTYVYFNTPNAPNSDGVWATAEASGSRIAALRTAVVNFFTTVNNGQAPGTRLRIGFVPYSSGVNMRGVLPAGTVQTGSADYDTRLANFNTSVWIPVTGAWSAWGNPERFNPDLSSADCAAWSTNQSFDYGSTNQYHWNGGTNPTGANPTANVYSETDPGPVTVYQYRNKVNKGGGNSTAVGECTRERQQQTTTYTRRFELTNWTYKSLSLSLANYLNGGQAYVSTVAGNAFVANRGSYNMIDLAAQTANSSGLTTSYSTPDGCIEERMTGDADIDGDADTADTMWRPTWRDMTYGRNANPPENNASTSGVFVRPTQDGTGYLASGYSCPKAARQLSVMTLNQVKVYLNAPGATPISPATSVPNTFVAHGFTYHDVGMIWAARLMSQDGVFSASHGAAPNGRATARHIVFMTDGDMQVTLRGYSPYGMEAVDRRIVKTGSLTTATQTAAHNLRFRQACQDAKDRKITVWVVAFGQTLTDELKRCATNEQHAFEAKNATELNDAFSQIAQRVAELRLSA